MDEWPDNDTWNRWKSDPSKWKWGLFYYNEKDKRLIVPKPTEGMGITINFADRRLVPLVMGILAFFATMALLVKFI